MVNLKNDYGMIAHPDILNFLLKENSQTFGGYGLDEHSIKAEKMLLSLCEARDSKVYFLPGGTITNKVFISHALRPYEAVISAESGHINVHETGAIEASGHKILTVPHYEGKIRVQDLKDQIAKHIDEHMVKPKLVYITDSTEYGTIYSRNELIAISQFCRENNLYLYLDGARLGVALTAAKNDITLADLAKYTDAFYIGGTKNGALLGEALIINNKDLQEDFRYSIKHFGGMYAKGFIAGMQFEVLFNNGLFFDISRKANALADKLKSGLIALGIDFAVDSDTNQLFPIFDKQVVNKLAKHILFEKWQSIADKVVVRFVTHYMLSDEDINKCLEMIKSAVKRVN